MQLPRFISAARQIAVIMLAGALTTKWVAGAVTLMPLLVPVIELVTVSVAVIVCVPEVFSVALKVPVPLLSVLLAGSDAVPSLLVKWTVPP